MLRWSQIEFLALKKRYRIVVGNCCSTNIACQRQPDAMPFHLLVRLWDLTSIRQHTSVYVSIHRFMLLLHSYAASPAYVSIRQHTSAYVSIRQHTSAYVSIRQHTSAYVSVRQHRSLHAPHHLWIFRGACKGQGSICFLKKNVSPMNFSGRVETARSYKENVIRADYIFLLCMCFQMWLHRGQTDFVIHAKQDITLWTLNRIYDVLGFYQPFPTFFHIFVSFFCQPFFTTPVADVVFLYQVFIIWRFFKKGGFRRAVTTLSRDELAIAHPPPAPKHVCCTQHSLFSGPPTIYPFASPSRWLKLVPWIPNKLIPVSPSLFFWGGNSKQEDVIKI